MARNRRKVYGVVETGAGAACAVCGCRHFDVAEREAGTGAATRRVCRNCGAEAPVPGGNPPEKK